MYSLLHLAELVNYSTVYRDNVQQHEEIKATKHLVYMHTMLKFLSLLRLREKLRWDLGFCHSLNMQESLLNQFMRRSTSGEEMQAQNIYTDCKLMHQSHA